MRSCTVDGRLCTACCRTILTTPGTNREALVKKINSGGVAFILSNWKPISRRRAKRKNPHMFTWLPADERRCRQKRKHGERLNNIPNHVKLRYAFWHCRRVTEEGCSVYEDRPSICRGYPNYSEPYPSWENRLAKLPYKKVPEYHPQCGQFPASTHIPVAQLP